MGKVVVATRAAEQGLDVGRHGGVLIADGPEDMALRVGETLDGVHDKIRYTARAIAESRFAWPTVLARLDDLLDGLENTDRRGGR